MTERTYRGLTIDRTPSSGMWRALGPNGWLKADTLPGIRALIREALGVPEVTR